MEGYGEILKRLIKFTDMKMSLIADMVGYDISYISKWCNKGKLPSSRVAVSVNKTLAGAFASEIMSQGEFDNFCTEFSLDIAPDELEDSINTMLKSSFKHSLTHNYAQTQKAVTYHSRTLVSRAEVNDFFAVELASMLCSSAEPSEVLCTFDICRILRRFPCEAGETPKLRSPIKVKIGINTEKMTNDDLLSLYCFINKQHYISFDFYDNSNFEYQNLLVIKNKVAAICSLDKSGIPVFISVINDPVKVNKMYEYTESLFKINHVLIMATTAKEMMRTGYRSNFYAYGDFQMFLARGCEFFIPPELIDSITKSAYEQGFDAYMEKILRKLIITWEDIFSKEKADFFVMKYTLLKYLEDGKLYFTDVMHKMTPEERTAHIKHVLDVYTKNKNLNFYVIDEEKIPIPVELISFSLFNNHKKLFLKNIKYFDDQYGPQFYSILNEKLINRIAELLESLKSDGAVACYPAVSLPEFMERYGGMVYRMLSLSELNDFCC